MRKEISLLLCALCGALFFAGCDAGYGPDETHPVYRKALRCRSLGKYAESEALLKRFLKSRPKSARGCLALAQLYDENLNDPLSAVYYYREFLKLDPDSTESRDVRRLMTRCEGRLQSAQARRDQTRKLEDENVRLKKTLIQYGKNMEQMRVELNESEKRAADAENKVRQSAAALQTAEQKGAVPPPSPQTKPASPEPKAAAAETPAENRKEPEKSPEEPPKAVADTGKTASAAAVPEKKIGTAGKAPAPVPAPKRPEERPDSLSYAFPAAGLSAVRPRGAAAEPVRKKLPEAAANPAKSAAVPEWPRTYVVKEGDSLSSISRKVYGTTRYYTKIMEVNHIQNTRGLMIGQKLILPAPEKEATK